MKRIRSYFGYGWAGLCFLIVIATFFLNPSFSRTFASVTGIAVSPWHTGGKVERTVDHGAYATRIHREVFEGLTGPRSTGFIQVDWTPRAGLPPVVEEEIDIRGRGKADFLIRLDTTEKTASLVPHDPSVGPVEHVYDLGKDGFAVRVLLTR